ncbi:sugar phosphate isomerase/epimerase [Rhodocytophaga aerolata]|uniref:Sugar phosphate isomerase/epimerase n=1 Tax=Rhodocytophaga aerolata TaxID=455078 RepID=A0ABT8RHW2_9BACT|nr:sugar phosphate isomerase/epimerase [Rhodocytophaga aerolata]MDO1450969.1 sugar phosphate isomerase/epimerase [Rhodocytophaga aerolata]
MQRRTFVKSLIMSASTMHLASTMSATPQNKPLGAQLWTIREYLKKDLTGSLAKLAKLGYNELELFGYDGTYWGKTPKEFSKICSDLGLKIISAHYETGRIDKAKGSLKYGWDKAVEDAAMMNIPYMICAWLFKEERTSLDMYKELIEMLNKSGEACRKVNIQFGYHGHNFEFPPIDGVVPYDMILQQTDKEHLIMEADLFWITKAGVDPVAYFKKYPGRFPLWHVKDMERGSEQFAEVGHGIINFDRIFAERTTAGLKHWFVEQDQTSREPFESLAMSRDYIMKKNYL